MTVLSTTHPEPASSLQDELVRFREEWKKEVQVKAQGSTHPKEAAAGESVPGESSGASKSPKKQRRASKTALGGSTHVGASQPHLAGLLSASAENVASPPERSLTRHTIQGHNPHPSAETTLGKAIKIYRDAVAAESEGDMDRAIQLYRQSFRLDSNVDKAYQRSRLAIQTAVSQTTSKPITHSPTQATHKRLHSGTKHGAIISLSHILDSLSEPWTSGLQFQPEDEKAPMYISTVPDEILVLILCHLAWERDIATIERFARVNRKARILSLDGGIWRYLVDSTYLPPQVNEDVDPRQLLAERYEDDCRHMYINHPRVRLDGVYIAVCHYIRPGHSENSWVNISHLITYHRYLRFLPDGTVLSLLTNDEVPPSQVVSQLKPSFRMKGFYIGTWYLDGTTVYVRDLVDPSGRFVKYGFEMTLQLKSRPIGRWNKLDILEYSSINVETLESVPLGLKHERSFWFSKVRSYAAQDTVTTLP